MEDSIIDPQIPEVVDTVVHAPLFAIAGTDITPATVVTFVIILMMTIVLSRLVQKAIRRGFLSRGVTDEGTVGTTSRLVHYAILMLGLGVGLQTIGINLSALFAAGAVAAVAIGFAMQNIVQNFVSGLLLLVERAIKPGDILEIEGQVVRVVEMGIRTAVVQTLDEEDLIVPNSVLVQSTVKNATLRKRLIRLRTTVGVSYKSDLDLVFDVLTRAALSVQRRVDTREPLILLLGFGNSSVDFEVSIWIDDPWRARPIRSDLNLAIWRGLADANITIPFPQVDVHFDPSGLALDVEAVPRLKIASNDAP